VKGAQRRFLMENFIIKELVRKPRTRWEDVVQRDTLQYRDGRDEQKREKHGGIF
jgi:hypothetical protein